MICSQLVHGLRQSIWGGSTLPSNWRDDGSWSTKWHSYSECISIYGYTLDIPIMNSNISYQIVMIHQAIILHRLLTLRGYWVYAEIIRSL